MKLRIKFKKYGSVRFLGHLDVMRYFQKAIRRAEIDIAYTTGFNPHQIMSFASPLGVGMESNGEYMDITVNRVTDSQDMKNRLNNTGAPGIEVISVLELPPEAGNAMASVAAAEYTIRFREGRAPSFAYEKEIDAFYQKEHIRVTKATKKGVHEVDLKPGIYALSASGDAIRMLVDASSSGNIRPALLIDAFVAEHMETLPENSLLITREELYTWEKTENNHNSNKLLLRSLVPLEAIGTEIVGQVKI